jgi:hypothetical protein
VSYLRIGSWGRECDWWPGEGPAQLVGVYGGSAPLLEFMVVKVGGSGWERLVVVGSSGGCWSVLVGGILEFHILRTLINYSTFTTFTTNILQWVTAMWGFATVTCSDLILPYSGSILDYLGGGTWR